MDRIYTCPLCGKTAHFESGSIVVVENGNTTGNVYKATIECETCTWYVQNRFGPRKGDDVDATLKQMADELTIEAWERQMEELKDHREGLDRVIVYKGLYQHYKGGKYVLWSSALHSETEEPFVVYYKWAEEDTCPPLDVRVMPYSRFGGKVEVDGKKVDRFQLINGDPFGELKKRREE